ncbi:CMGC/CDK/CDK10 protein kinase [Salpingoeca rosetta]|uniref:cyclin-dependent kinase n=1 Tax=Salpingoeca rosetta (strain ATCC 50818 / BSB-021) TaxID=946362 RepID=F2UJD1_SALR5|nr:CMGC/CDK/CDK10 protein kinase [Salpingoeca rosetta]EGD77230.1 CMGC/CDK/CDK10 protein kinase [Salpingoeca rosetta]|eukprot:XP_004990574.1 CMGC/CDK/CDK10 protein kinase [Salpingoeca rosetta]
MEGGGARFRGGRSHRGDDGDASGSSRNSVGEGVRGRLASARDSLKEAEYTIKVPRGFAGRCREIDDFERLGRLGEGTYGIVYKAKDIETGAIVAVKRIKMKDEREGMPQTSLREVTTLKAMEHENVVQLLDIAVGGAHDQVYLIFEYCEHDLAWLVDNLPAPFPETVAKSLTVQLLKGLRALHSMFIVHRDIKLSNLLLNSRGYLKIADFGLARRSGDPPRPKTTNVVTLWYRAPELLFGDKAYTSKVDCWSAGCVMGELLAHKPILPGKSEVSQLDLIIQLLGTPNEAIWPGFSSLPLASRFQLTAQPYSNLKDEFRFISDRGIDLLQRLLTYDPHQRWSCDRALGHAYFREFPYPCTPDMMPTFAVDGRGDEEATEEREEAWEDRGTGKRPQQPRQHSRGGGGGDGGRDRDRGRDRGRGDRDRDGDDGGGGGGGRGDDGRSRRRRRSSPSHAQRSTRSKGDHRR